MSNISYGGKSMRYSEDLIEEIRMKNDIVDVISGYVKLQKKGSNHFGLCPFHNEKSPSLSVSQGKQMYHCFGCGAGGNVYTFVMNYENFTFVEAIKFLAERVGITLPEVEYSAEERKQADEKLTILELNKMAANYFYYQLQTSNGGQALAYLRGRKISDEIIKKFGLGYNDRHGGLYKYIKSKGYTDDVLRKSGLFQADNVKGMYDKFWNRVMFPIMDVNNRVIGFGGRVMGDGQPKYMNSPETKVFDKSRNLYGLNFARTSRKPYILICEGYMDVIALHQAGFQNAVASLGTAFTSGQCNLLKRYTEEVLLTYDSDEAGTKAALRAIPILKESGLTVKVIDMTPYKDPDEFIKNLGADAFEERIRNSSNSFLYEIGVLEQNYNMKDPEGKTQFISEVAKKLLDFTEEIERNNYIDAVAAKYHTGYESLRKLVNHYGVSSGGIIKEMKRPKPLSSTGREKEDGIKQSQKLLMTWLIESQNLFELISKYIQVDDFVEPLYHTVATILFEQYKDGSINPAKIISHFTKEDEQREVAALFNATLKKIETKEEKEKAIKETIIKVKNNSVEHKTKNLDPTDIAGLQNLVALKRKLQDLEKLHISLD